jgi:uncharacterized damage-inducible protein DinB
MRRPFAIALTIAALAALPIVAAAQEGGAPASSVKSEILVWISDAEGKLNELAQAMPEGKYTWRPGKDVRSVGEIYLHVASANFGIPSFLGVTPPEGFKFEGYEKSMTKKEDITKALQASFVHVKSVIEKSSDADMEQPAEFFGMKTTRRGAFLLILSHAHEHLGQSIAYARSNGVTPPWTARQVAAADAKKKADAEKK